MNTNNEKVEHFCTLFDSNFLPIGITLHSSLMLHAKSFHLWIVCMDEKVEEQLKIIALPHITLIPLRDMETPELLAVKPGRNRAEYCWTITPFTFTAVFERSPNLERVTYLDADLFFFDNPEILLEEFTESERHILITEHAYDPHYDQTLTSGKFCVQFLTVNNNERGLNVIKWWQKKCLNWCFARLENGKFGDQKYLDTWSLLFSDDVWILQQKERTLAPWNIYFFCKELKRLGYKIHPVFYHFHGLRIINHRTILMNIGYRIGKQGMNLYQSYCQELLKSIALMQQHNIKLPVIPYDFSGWSLWTWTKYRLKRIIHLKNIS